MGIAPVTVTWADGSTIRYERAGDVVTATAIPATVISGAFMTVPEGFQPLGDASLQSSPESGAYRVTIGGTSYFQRFFEGNDPTVVQYLADPDTTGIAELDVLLASLPGFGLLTDNMKQNALSGALIPDSAGVWPGQDFYVPTYDVYYAAVGLVGFLQAQPVVRQTSSEGTSVAVDAPNWAGLVGWYNSLSPIYSAQPSTVLRSVPIPEGPHVRRTDMSGRYDSNGDVDTDA